MPAYPYAELSEMVERWLEANRKAQELGDWTGLSDMFTEDATYGWNVGPKDEFMAVGRAEIREIAVGQEMGGLDGWVYPYQKVLIDEHQGEVVGFWKQIAGATRPDGGTYEVQGIGGSWFRYGGDGKWSWQRDFFDVGNATSVYMEMIRDQTLSEGMTRRMERAMTPGRLPGHYAPGTAPVGLWD
jgi:hypothetical protein